MTNKQIEEINELIDEHASTLTAFYDEGIAYGRKMGAKRTLIGGLVTAFAIGAVKILKK
jgi:hypothetical protein